MIMYLLHDTYSKFTFDNYLCCLPFILIHHVSDEQKETSYECGFNLLRIHVKN